MHVLTDVSAVRMRFFKSMSVFDACELRRGIVLMVHLEMYVEELQYEIRRNLE